MLYPASAAPCPQNLGHVHGGLLSASEFVLNQLSMVLGQCWILHLVWSCEWAAFCMQVAFYGFAFMSVGGPVWVGGA